MILRSLCLMVLACVFIGKDAEAGRSGGSGRSSGSGGYKSSSYKSAGATSSMRGSGFSGRPVKQSLSGTTRRSLLSNRPPISSKLQERIREKERSGPGWIGTAVLIALLSQHDLSSSDKSWLRNQIAAKEREGETEADKADFNPDYVLKYVGLKGEYLVGQVVNFTVSAADKRGAVAPVRCELPGATVKAVGRASQVEWSPIEKMVQILRCQVGGQSEQRLIKIL